MHSQMHMHVLHNDTSNNFYFSPVSNLSRRFTKRTFIIKKAVIKTPEYELLDRSPVPNTQRTQDLDILQLHTDRLFFFLSPGSHDLNMGSGTEAWEMIVQYPPCISCTAGAF